MRINSRLSLGEIIWTRASEIERLEFTARLLVVIGGTELEIDFDSTKGGLKDLFIFVNIVVQSF